MQQPLLYPDKISENIYFFDVFRGYRKVSVAWNGLVISGQDLHANYKEIKIWQQFV